MTRHLNNMWLQCDLSTARRSSSLNEKCNGVSIAPEGETLPDSAWRALQRICEGFDWTFHKSHFRDGYVCLQIDSCTDCEKIVMNARAAIERANRDNIMISLLATDAGIEAGEALLFNGVSVHFRVFSLSHYERVLKSYLRAIKERDIHFKTLHNVVSVASFDLYAIDRKVNELLSHKNDTLFNQHGNSAALAIANLALQKYARYFSGEAWRWLSDHGAQTQRLMWDVSKTDVSMYSELFHVPNTIVLPSIDQLEQLERHVFESSQTHPQIDAGTILRDLGMHDIHLDEVGELLVSMQRM